MFLKEKFLVFKTVDLHNCPIVLPLNLFNVYLLAHFNQQHLMHFKEYNDLKESLSQIARMLF